MSRIRAKDTTPERLLRSALHRSGFRFRLHQRSLPGSPDMVLPKHKAIIFVHGCFWHQHQECRNAVMPKTRREFWNEKLSSNRRRDAMQIKTLIAGRWRVLVVWECALRIFSVRDQVIRRTVSWLRSNSAHLEISGNAVTRQLKAVA